MMILTEIQERKRFFRFAIVGTIGFFVDSITFNLFRTYAGFSPVLSSVFSFTAAVLSNFFLNRIWTFSEIRSKSMGRQMLQFFIVSIIGLGIRTIIFAFITDPLIYLVELLPVSLPFESYRIGENLALATVVIIVLFWNFFANRYWTFNDNK